MVARPILPSKIVVESDDTTVVRQDFGADGAFIVTPDTQQQWPVTAQARDTKGTVRDLLATTKGELLVAPSDHVIYENVYSGTAVANVTALLGPVPAEGFVSAVFMSSASIATAVVQVTWDGIQWASLTGTLANLMAGGIAKPRNLYVGSNYPVMISIPPCKQIRVSTAATQTLSNCKITLGLSKTSRTDFVAAYISDSQIVDKTQLTNYNQVVPIQVGGVDSTKKQSVLAMDTSTNPRVQGEVNTTGSQGIPYYGGAVATAITRASPQAYLNGQPAALQSNTLGELKIDNSELRNMLEMQQLQLQAAAMQALDPNWGFELR